MPIKGHVTCTCGSCRKCRHRDYMRGYYQRNRDALLAKERERREAGGEVVERRRAYDRQRGYRVYDEQKMVARRRVSHAIRDGRLKREPCEKCGAPAQAHHDDHSKPLDVRWLCLRHHGEVHRMVA